MKLLHCDSMQNLNKLFAWNSKCNNIRIRNTLKSPSNQMLRCASHDRLRETVQRNHNLGSCVMWMCERAYVVHLCVCAVCTQQWWSELKVWIIGFHITPLRWTFISIICRFPLAAILLFRQSHHRSYKFTFNWYSRRTHFRAHKLLSTNVSEIDNLSPCLTLTIPLLYLSLAIASLYFLIDECRDAIVFNSRRLRVHRTCSNFVQKTKGKNTHLIQNIRPVSIDTIDKSSDPIYSHFPLRANANKYPCRNITKSTLKLRENKKRLLKQK